MSFRSHLKEEQADLDVKQVAWNGTKKRLSVWVRQYAEKHVIGESPTGYQKAILSDAKSENFPKTVVKALGNLKRRIDNAKPEDKSELEKKYRERLRKYAHKLDFGQVAL